MKKRPELPLKRVGLCCGCRSLEDKILFRIGMQFRYRCAQCYERETGARP